MFLDSLLKTGSPSTGVEASQVVLGRHCLSCAGSIMWIGLMVGESCFFVQVSICSSILSLCLYMHWEGDCNRFYHSPDCFWKEKKDQLSFHHNMLGQIPLRKIPIAGTELYCSAVNDICKE